MNGQEIIEMAKQAGFDEHNAKFDTRIEAFANLVAAKEREACLSIAESMSLSDANMSKSWRTGCRDVSEEIRTRGEA